MSQRDRDRLIVLHQLHDGILTVSTAARRLRIGTRHMRRLRRRFKREGDVVVVHRLRGRPSNRRLPPELRAKALERARDPCYEDFGPTLLSEHLGRDGVGVVHRSTLRLWMIEAEVWTPEKRKARHRRRRERRAAYGEMILMDTSVHPWLEGRSEEEIVLIAMIDDATSRLYGRFAPRDTGAANRQMIVDYLQRFGRMGALYTDQASHFQAHFRASERREKDQEEALTLIRRALGALEIELIIALSPQAKGRVERLFKTLQDRLIKEMRVRGIRSLEEANRFLEEEFIPFWNERFTVEPTVAVDAHRPLPEGIDLLRLFAETDTRVIANDFTFRYKNQWFQIEKAQADAASIVPKQRLTIERRLDGTTRFRFGEHYLSPSPLAVRTRERTSARGTPVSAQVEIGAYSSNGARHLGSSSRRGDRAKPKAPARPAPDHPWRRYPIRVGRALRRLSPAVASAPSALRPDSPRS